MFNLFLVYFIFILLAEETVTVGSVIEMDRFSLIRLIVYRHMMK